MKTVITPQDMIAEEIKIESALSQFAEKLRIQEKGKDFYKISILGEYGDEFLNEVANIYNKAGWIATYFHNSPEFGKDSVLLYLVRK